MHSAHQVDVFTAVTEKDVMLHGFLAKQQKVSVMIIANTPFARTTFANLPPTISHPDSYRKVYQKVALFISISATLFISTVAFLSPLSVDLPVFYLAGWFQPPAAR